MITLKNDLNGFYDDTCVKVYDPAEKKLIGVFHNYLKAANRIGITASQVQQRCQAKTRVYSPVYKKEIAIRLSGKKPGDDELIDKTIKNKPL